MAETLKADVIINALKEQANAILSASLGSTPLESFNIGSLGNMPYYWQDPRNLEFNSLTYNWISANLKANTTPLQLDQPFTNLFINVFGKINYSLSTDDLATLNKAKENATTQQGAVLKAWVEAFGSLPDGKGQPIDNIATVIATEWAKPPTTLTKIQASTNLNALLNKVPASGKPVVLVFAVWLNAISAAISLANATTMNTAYLAQALAAAQTASKANGGMLLNNSDNTYHPAYAMAASSSLSDIINGLNNSSQAAKLSLTVTRTTEDEFQVSISGGASLSIPVLDFFSLNVGGNASYFQSDIATTDNKTTVDLTYPGVTLVNYGPVPFEQATSQNWYWTQPITDAIKNGDSDVSGFKFAPDPQVDFSKSGPFGFLMGAAISNYPSMVITVTSSNYERIQKTFQQSASVGISFLGIPLGIGGRESSYSNSVEVNSSTSTVTITLNPPQELVAGTNTDSVGWVLGVQPSYPAA